MKTDTVCEETLVLCTQLVRVHVVPSPLMGLPDIKRACAQTQYQVYIVTKDGVSVSS